MTIEEQIDAAIKQNWLDHEQWRKEKIDVEKEDKKREHFFQKFNTQKPSWWLKPGDTRVLFDGKKVTFSRPDKESFSIEDIKKCDIWADGHTIKREESAPFSISTKYNVSLSYPTHGSKKGGDIQFFDGTEMSVMVRSSAYIQEEEDQAEKMREELGCSSE